MQSHTTASCSGREPQVAKPLHRHDHPPQPTPRVRDHSLDKGATGTVRQIIYHLYTIWLFSASDVSTTLVQCVLYGVAGAASGRLTTPTSAPAAAAAPGPWAQLPLAVAALWLLLLPFQISNQSTPGAPQEDAQNKPWRPIPAGRISQAAARRLVGPAALAALAFFSAFAIGPEAAGFVAFVYLYNDFGASELLVPRYLANGFGVTMLIQAALKLAVYPESMNRAGYQWSFVHFLIFSTTIHIMDFRDQEGDAATGRHTLPLVLGDSVARWVTLVPILFWTFLCPWLFDAGVLGYSLSTITASVVIFGLLSYRTPKEDQRNYKMWSVWLAVIYAMPWLALFG